MPAKVMRQPSASPTTRPSGMPSTIASEVPVASRPSALAWPPSGATRTASAAVIDQNTAWARAMPMRLAISSGQLQATAETAWLAQNSTNTASSSLRRSMWRVASISGNEVSATIQA